MKGLHRALGLLLIPLLIALMAAPVAAAPGNGTPKTNQEHHSWLRLDPVPETTADAEVTLTGMVAGHFEMSVQNDTYLREFVASGKFSVQVALIPGENHITITGLDKAGRLLNYELVIERTSGGDSGGGGDEGTEPNRVEMEVDQVTLVANGQSTMTVRAIVVDSTGEIITDYRETISFTTSNPSAVAVLTPQVNPKGGIAIATLRAGTVPETAIITATAPGVGSVTAEITPEGQVAGSLAVSASSATLPAGGATEGTLTLRLKDSSGIDVYTMSGPLMVQLTTNRPDVVRFADGSDMYEIMMTSPTATVAVRGGVPGTAVISGAAIRDDGAAITVQAVSITTVNTP